MSGTALVLCADDYGMNAGVGRAVRALAEQGRVSATSCMANARGWPAEADALRSLAGRVGVGLHLTLTWGRPLGPMPRLAPDGVLPTIGTIMRLSLAGRLDPAEIRGEAERQLARFTEWFGQLPDFLDGHQHVHVLPGVRGPVLAALAGAGLAGRVWLRDPGDRPGAILARREAGKAMVVAAMATGFRAAAAEANVPTNQGFSGFSPFDPGVSYGEEMAGFLRSLGPAPLLMCHPGEACPPADDGAEADEIAAARPRELAYLRSDAFAHLLGRAGIRLVRRPA